MISVAFFDFDHTLYKKDSLLEFTRSSVGNTKFAVGLVLLSPYLLMMKLGLAANSDVKQKFFAYFFAGMQSDRFHALADEFAKDKLPAGLDHKTFTSLQKHREAGHKIVIVTASMAEWIKPWSDQYEVEVIGTKPETKNGKLTGKFATANCNRDEKVNRVNQIYNLNDFDSVYVYGKGKGDREMLTLKRNCQTGFS